MMKDFYKFVISALSVIAIVFIIDFSFGAFLEKKAVFVDQPKYKRISTADEELVILGASRAQNQYVTDIISDGLDISAFNYGYGAQNVYSSYAVLDMLIRRAPVKPKFVIWDFYYTDILDSPGWNTEKLYRFYSAYNYDPAVKAIVELQGTKKSSLLKSIRLYKFNSKLPRVLLSQRDEVNGGYSPLFNQHQAPIELFTSDRTLIDNQKFLYVNRLIDLCKSNNISLYVFIAPAYYVLKNPKDGDWKEMIKKTCREKDIQIYDYEQDSLFLSHPEWFFNPMHLNDIGAKEYTKRVVDDIRSLLSE